MKNKFYNNNIWGINFFKRLIFISLVLFASQANAANFSLSGDINNSNTVGFYDAYSINASVDTLISIRTDSAALSFDPQLHLWDSSGIMVYYSDDNKTLPSQSFFDSSIIGNIAAGNYTLTISSAFYSITSNNLLNAFSSLPLISLPGSNYNINISGNGVSELNNITATPIPGAVWLMGSGLIGILGLSRKKKA